MTILITGVAGFIGSSFAKWLIKNHPEHKIIGIDNLSGGFEENVPNGFDFYTHDCNSVLTNEIFEKLKPDVCYCLHAYASEGRSNHIPRFIHENNTLSTSNIINACVNNNCKLIFASSVAVYSGEPPFSENSIPNPIDSYGNSKLTSEKEIQIASKVHGLDYVIVRPRNVYGSGQNIFDPSRNLFGILCYAALNNLPINVFGSGENTRNFTHINDILRPLYNCTQKHINKTSINLGSSMVYSINQVVRVFGEVTGYKNVIHVEPRHEVPNAFCSTEVAEKILGYKHTVSLRDGINEMWEWAKTQPKRNLMVPPKLEITKNLHSSLK